MKNGGRFKAMIDHLVSVEDIEKALGPADDDQTYTPSQEAWRSQASPTSAPFA
jgi:hypothetical protein